MSFSFIPVGIKSLELEMIFSMHVDILNKAGNSVVDSCYFL